MNQKFLKRKIGKHLVNVTMLGLALAPVASSVVAVTPVYAAEYKSGQAGTNKLEFTATSKTSKSETKVSQHKPMDLVAILDYSSSYQAKRNASLQQLKTLIESDLTNDDHIMLQAYIYNKPESYAAHGAQLDYNKLKDANWETGVSTTLLTKQEALAMIDKLLEIKYPNTPGGLLTYSDLFNAVSKTFGDKAYKNADTDGGKVTITPFEDVYAAQPNKSALVSVIQFTDGWADTERMDSTFATWAKKNAKTFMSVVNRNKVSDADNNDPNSVKSMAELGHPNIYDMTGKDEATVTKELLEQFKNTATEKVVEKVTTTKQKAHITITPEAGVTLKTAELVDTKGKVTPLAIKDNKVVADTADLEDGKYVVNYGFDGKVDAAKKIVGSVSVDGKEVDHKEDTVLPEEKPVKRTEKIPFKTTTVEDKTLKAGEKKVVTKGVEGEKEVSTLNGKSTETVLKAPIDEVIAIGTKGSETETTDKKVPFETIYKVDPTLKKGEEKVITEGVEGLIKVTTTYETQKGVKVPGSEKSTEEVVREKVDKVIAQGSMEKRKVLYRVVDSKGQELVKETSVTEAYQDEEYKVETPKLDGYRLELQKEGTPASGKVADRDVLVTFVAVKIGKPVILKFVDESGKEISEQNFLAKDGLDVGTVYNGEAPEFIEKNKVKYAFVGIKETGATERKLSGEVTDKEQVIHAVYAKPKETPKKELPKTSEQLKARNGVIAGLVSLAGFGSVLGYFGLRKRS